MNLDRLATALTDRYRIERELGQGGMATVYLAEDLRHSRKVAIKVLREDLAASLGSNRFLREIQIAAQLQHPNILPLLDSGDADGFLYYVMPFVPGQSLRERLAREGELPVHEAVRLLCEVTDALAHSHQMGVVHRDIKPDNVMMSGRHALVTDFGVAKAISEATGRNTITTLGVAVGTPTYMSPEQASADPHIDHRSDIYAVGVMAYEMLTGRPPFTGATPQQVLAAHVTEAPDSVSKRRPAIAAPLEQIVMKCLAKRPADRYQTADELLHLLEAQATPSTGVTPTQTRPVSAWTAPVRSRRWLLPAVAGAAVLAIAAAVWMGRGAEVLPPANAQRTQVTFSGTAEFATSLSPDVRQVAYADRICSADYNCRYDLVVQDVAGSGTARIVHGMSAIYEIRWTGDGRTLLLGGLLEGRQVAFYAVPALGGEPPRLISPTAVRLYGPGDSAMIGNAPAPGRLVLRATTLSNPTQGDTIVFERAGVETYQWNVSPGGKWLVVGTQVDGRRIGLVLDRQGTVRDSLDVEGVQTAGFVADDRLVLASLDSSSPGALRLVEHRLRPDGRMQKNGREIASGIPGIGLSFGPGGIAYLSGTTRFSVMAMSRTEGGGGIVSTRTVATSTGFLGALMGSDGTFVIIERRDPADPNASRLMVQPFDGGAERLIGGGQLNIGSARSRTVDGKGLVVLARAGDRYTLTEYDLASGRSTPRGTMPNPGQITGLEAMADGSLAWQPDEMLSLIRVRAPDGQIRSIATPNVVTETLEDSPNGHGLLGWGFSLPNFDSVVVYHIPPGATEGRSLVRAVFDYIPGHRWLADGNVELVISETLASSAFYHLDVATGALRREGTVPLNFINAISFANDGRRLSARVVVPTLDVWTLTWDK